MSYAWFRMYAEFATDPKVQRLSEVDQRRFVMLLCLRCCNGDVTLHDDDVTFQLRITDDEWAKTKATLIGKNMIGADNKPTSWDKRQFASDSSKLRVSKYRENKKKAGNGDVTLQKRPCNAPDTDTDTDTDTEETKRNARVRTSRRVTEVRNSDQKELRYRRIAEKLGREAMIRKNDEIAASILSESSTGTENASLSKSKDATTHGSEHQSREETFSTARVVFLAASKINGEWET